VIPRRYISFVNYFLGIVLAAGVGYLIWTIVVPPRAGEVGASVTYEHDGGSGGEASAPGPGYYGAILARNLWQTKFQPPEEKAPPTPPPPTAPPPRLELKGTSVFDDPRRSWAIIEDLASKTQKIYRLDDVIRGWRVVEIDRIDVTLENNGRRHVISSFIGHIPVPENRLHFSRVFKKLGPNRWLVSRRGMWKLVNEKMLEKLARGGENFRLVPDDVIGSLRTVGCRPWYPPQGRTRGPASGYEIVVLPREHLAYKLGVREGDVIQEVNGLTITGKQEAMDILLKIQDAQTVVVDVLRGDRHVQLEYLVQDQELDPTQ